MTESKTKKQCRKSNQSVTKIKINFQILNIILLVCVNIFFRPQPNSCVGFFGVVFIRPRPNLSVGFCLILFDHDLIWALAFVWFLFDHNQFWALAFVLVFYSTENKFERWLLCWFFIRPKTNLSVGFCVVFFYSTTTKFDTTSWKQYFKFLFYSENIFYRYFFLLFNKQ